MKYKGILLDLDNTVYTYNESHEPALEAALRHLSSICHLSIGDLAEKYDLARANVKVRTKGSAASHNRLLYFQNMCEMLKIAPYELAIALDETYWLTYFKHMEIRPGFDQFLRTIKPLPIVIVTDLTVQIQIQKIIHLGLQEHITALVTSEEAGFDKPHPEIFMLAANKIGMEPKDLCMIGDSWEKDILGALQFDMHCYWLKEELTSEPGKSSPKEFLEAHHKALVHEFCSFKELFDQVTKGV